MATSPRISPPEFAPAIRPDQVEDLIKLQKAAKKISSILDLDELIDQVVHDIAASFGCLEANLYLRDRDKRYMVLASVCGCTKSSKGQSLEIGNQGMVGYVAATGQMRYAPDVSRDPYYVACEKSTRSEVAIPLEINGEVIGVFTAAHPDLDAFPSDQLRLLQSLCSHVAVAVQNAQLFQREREERERMAREAQEARQIQQALLPKSSPYVPGFVIAGQSCPAGAVGGDWFDFIPLSDGRWGLVLADVAGKGTAAALLMSSTRGMLRSLAEACCTPAEVMGRLNRLMVDDIPNGRFVTMVYAILDPVTHSVTFANAGHLPPLLVDSSGAHFLTTEAGLPLGIIDGPFAERTVQLKPGSRLFFYSDGITEAEDSHGEEYGLSRLQAQVSQESTTPESILNDVHAFSAPAPLLDDASVIGIKLDRAVAQVWPSGSAPGAP
jgi:sigma-B regulation protein RsbU (phosphoserine phosphatase)